MRCNSLRVAILYSGSISRAGGTSERVLQISTELAKQNVQVTLSGSLGRWAEESTRSNLRFIAKPDSFLQFRRASNWFAQLVAGGLTHRYDVVQIESFSIFKTIALFFLLRFCGKKFIVVYHDKWFTNDPRKNAVGRIALFFQRILFVISAGSITPGLSIKKWFEKLHGTIVSEKMVVIPNGAPLLPLKENSDSLSLRVKYGLDLKAYVVLFFGLMTFGPNHEAALRLYDMSSVVAEMFERANRKELVFVVAGVGSESLPRTKHYSSLGFIQNLNELLALPDAIVFPHTPSYSGPHVKTIYAFLSMKPVIASGDAVKDMPGLVAGHHFLKFDVDEPNSLLNALSELSNRRELCKTLTSNAYAYAREFSWERISSMHLELYKELRARDLVKTSRCRSHLVKGVIEPRL
jgi:glycosyltransferase involved in cell wall biosynthesis